VFRDVSRERDAATVRAAEPNDISRIIEIATESATAARWNPKEYENLFAHGARDAHGPKANRTALVIEENGMVSGFIVAHQIGDEWEIENIAVAQRMQHRGLGTRLLTEFLELVRRQKGRQIFLEVRESNLAARALYRKSGFKETGRRKSYYENPPEDALILRFIFSI
jgi:ribosomal-protein-alanine acetyltransferase